MDWSTKQRKGALTAAKPLPARDEASVFPGATDRATCSRVLSSNSMACSTPEMCEGGKGANPGEQQEPPRGLALQLLGLAALTAHREGTQGMPSRGVWTMSPLPGEAKNDVASSRDRACPSQTFPLLFAPCFRETRLLKNARPPGDCTRCQDASLRRLPRTEACSEAAQALGLCSQQSCVQGMIRTGTGAGPRAQDHTGARQSQGTSHDGKSTHRSHFFGT